MFCFVFPKGKIIEAPNTQQPSQGAFFVDVRLVSCQDNYLKGGCSKVEVSLFFQVTEIGWEVTAFKVAPGEGKVRCLEKSILWKSGELLEQAVQGGSEATIPGGVQENRCCTEEHDLVGMVRLGWQLD